jgi:hypothetical protein
MDVPSFEKRYVREVGVRKSLKEYANGDCVFFDRGRWFSSRRSKPKRPPSASKRRNQRWQNPMTGSSLTVRRDDHSRGQPLCGLDSSAILAISCYHD